MKYRICPYCGAHLDFGEVCDCQKGCNGGALRRNNKIKLEKENQDGQHDVPR